MCIFMDRDRWQELKNEYKVVQAAQKKALNTALESSTSLKNFTMDNYPRGVLVLLSGIGGMYKPSRAELLVRDGDGGDGDGYVQRMISSFGHVAHVEYQHGDNQVRANV